MNNKCGQNSQGGFVPAGNNWDFGMECGGRSKMNGARQEHRCAACEATEASCGRVNRETVCSACGYPRHACRCGQDNEVRTNGAACPAEQPAPACVMKRTESACGTQKGVGIVRGTMQVLGEIFDSARALRDGTLFPELHKPMNGYWPCGTECGDTCQQAAFAAWDLRLYLDTHPDDQQARALMSQLAGDCCDPNYATTLLPQDCSHWAWTDDPWPWQINAQRSK